MKTNRYRIAILGAAIAMAGACSPSKAPLTRIGGNGTGGDADPGGSSGGGGSDSGGTSATGGYAGSGTGGTIGVDGSTSDSFDAAAGDAAIDALSDASQIRKSDWNAYLPLASGSTDNGDPGTTADVSGHGYLATYGRGVSFSNGAIVMSGRGDVSIAPKDAVPAINLTKSYSVSAWVTMTDRTGWRTFVSADGKTVSAFYLQVRSDSGHFAFTLSNADTNDGVTSPCVAESSTPPDPDTLYHLVATRDGDTELDTLYVNGVDVGTQSCPSSSGAGWAASSFGIGHGMYNGSITDYVSGTISGVGLIGRVLSANEVAALYALGNK